MLNLENTSYWERKTFFNEIDYLVVGAGIVGYSTALHLRELHPKAKIVIIERGFLPSGASSKNAGFACFGSATELYDDLQNIDEQTVWETVNLRWKGLNYLRSLLGDDGLRIEVNGSWDLITHEDLDLFEKTRALLPYLNERIEKITGEANVYSIDHEIKSKFGFESVEVGISNRLEGQIDTALMNQSFHSLVINQGIHVLFGIEANRIEKAEHQLALHTNYGIIETKKAAICTNGFAKQLLPQEDITPARAQVLITKPIKNLSVKGTFHYNQGYYYFRNIDNRILFGGGRNLDFDGETTTHMNTTKPIMEKLEDMLRNVILPHTDFEIDHSWSGIMGVGNTKRPIIKEVEPNVFCGVRLGGMGVAIGSLVGKELAELMK